MIGRIWGARAATTADADAYQRVFGTDVAAELRGVSGCRGGWLLRRDEPGGGAQFLALTLFEDMAAVRDFAGDDPIRANVSAPARAVLARFDTEARHYTIATALDVG